MALCGIYFFAASKWLIDISTARSHFEAATHNRPTVLWHQILQYVFCNILLINHRYIDIYCDHPPTTGQLYFDIKCLLRKYIRTWLENHNTCFPNQKLFESIKMQKWLLISPPSQLFSTIPAQAINQESNVVSFFSGYDEPAYKRQRASIVPSSPTCKPSQLLRYLHKPRWETACRQIVHVQTKQIFQFFFSPFAHLLGLLAMGLRLLQVQHIVGCFLCRCTDNFTWFAVLPQS